MSTAALLEVEGLNAGYGKSQVLFGMALRVDAGTCSTLLGRNGMGKTTTIKSIMGLIGPTGGAVRWCGRDVRLTDTDQRQNALQYVGVKPPDLVQLINRLVWPQSDDALCQPIGNL